MAPSPGPRVFQGLIASAMKVVHSNLAVVPCSTASWVKLLRLAFQTR